MFGSNDRWLGFLTRNLLDTHMFAETRGKDLYTQIFWNFRLCFDIWEEFLEV